MKIAKNFFYLTSISVLILSITLSGCSYLPWSSSDDDEDLFFEEDFGNEFETDEKGSPTAKKKTDQGQEDDFFKDDVAQNLPKEKPKSESTPVAPDEEDFFYEDEASKSEPKPSSTPKPRAQTNEKIDQDSGVISDGGGGFVSVDQPTDREELKVDVASLYKQQQELLYRVQELQKIVNNLEPRLTATQERVESSLGDGSLSPKVKEEIKFLKAEIVRLKNEIEVLKKNYGMKKASVQKKTPVPSKQAKLIHKARPIRRYPKLSRTPAKYNEALAAYNKGNYDKSILLFQELNLSNPPENLKDNILFWIGSNYMRLGMYDDAIQHFKLVLKQYPRGNKIHDSRFLLGVCYQKKGDTGRALDALEVALKGNPPLEIRQKIEKQMMEIK